MDDSNQRTEKLREQLKTANQKILFLQNEDTNIKSGVVTNNATINAQLKQSVELNEQKGKS